MSDTTPSTPLTADWVLMRLRHETLHAECDAARREAMRIVNHVQAVRLARRQEMHRRWPH